MVQGVKWPQGNVDNSSIVVNGCLNFNLPHLMLARASSSSPPNAGQGEVFFPT